MHEAAIAQGIVDAVRQAIPAARRPAVRVVHVRIGVLRAVWPEALHQAFEATVHDSDLAGSRVDIVSVKATGTCAACGHRFDVSGIPVTCPRCDGVHVTIEGGDALSVDRVTVEE